VPPSIRSLGHHLVGRILNPSAFGGWLSNPSSFVGQIENPSYANRLERLTVVLWSVLLAVVCVRTALAPQHRSVYPDYANAARDWLAGADIYEWNKNSPDRFRYSPTAAVCMIPFAILPDSVGGVLWRLLNAGVFLAAWLWWCRAVLPDGESLTRRQLAVMGLILIPLSVSSMSNGQVNPLVIGLLLGSMAAAARGRWNLAAVAVAVATFFKIYPVAAGLLLTLMYPRRFTLRFLLALTVGAVLPFLFQYPGYVLQEYQTWFHSLGEENRHNWPLALAPYDLWLLVRLTQTPISPAAYTFIQLGLAGGVAGLCLLTRLSALPVRQCLTVLSTQVCCWMILCGPATEWPTYILLAPIVAWVVIDAWHARRSLAARVCVSLILGMLLVPTLMRMFPGGHKLFLGVAPLATILLMVYLTTIQLAALLRIRPVGPDIQDERLERIRTVPLGGVPR
jgi:hypothetical protein